MARLILLGGFLLASTAAAQTLEQRGQAWWFAFGQGKAGQYARIWIEAQPRAGLSDTRFDVVILRAAVGIEPVAGLSFWMGFAWVPSWQSPFFDDLTAGEGRLYQQIMYTKALGSGFRGQLRFRMEERLIEGVNGPVYRARMFGRLTWTFHDRPTLLLALQDEIFGNFNDRAGSPPAGFDQNRAYVGIGWQPSSDVLLELGYLQQLVRRRDPSPWRLGHTAMLTTAFFW